MEANWLVSDIFFHRLVKFKSKKSLNYLINKDQEALTILIFS